MKACLLLAFLLAAAVDAARRHNFSVADWLPEDLSKSTSPDVVAYLEGGVASCWHTSSTQEDFVTCVEYFVNIAVEYGTITDPSLAEAIIASVKAGSPARARRALQATKGASEGSNNEDVPEDSQNEQPSDATTKEGDDAYKILMPARSRQLLRETVVGGHNHHET